jgi:hypothetical protein
MDSRKVVGIMRDNLDEIAQPLSEAILLLSSLSEEIAENDKMYPLIKMMHTRLDNMSDIIGCIYQTTWFSIETMCIKQKHISKKLPSNMPLTI